MNRNLARKLILPSILTAGVLAVFAGGTSFARYNFTGPFAENPAVELLEFDDPFPPEDRGGEDLMTRDIERRFKNAPDFTHQIAIAFARGEEKATHAVTRLDEDLLADTFKSDVISLPGGREITTTSSLLAEAVRSRDHTATKIILERLGPEYKEAQRIALGFALTGTDPDTGRHPGEIFLKLFAEAGGSATSPRLPNTGESLAELLALTNPALLRPFLDKGFDPWAPIDPDLQSSGGLSLGEILSLSASREAIRALEWLITQPHAKEPSFRASANILSNLENRLGPKNTPEILKKHFSSFLLREER